MNVYIVLSTTISDGQCVTKVVECFRSEKNADKLCAFLNTHYGLMSTFSVVCKYIVDYDWKK